MADYCDIEEIKMTPNPVYSEAQTKRQIDKHISKKTSELVSLSTAKTVIICVLSFCFALLLIALLIAVLAVTVSSSRKPVYSSCAELAESSPLSVSGYYVIRSSNGSLFQVYCEMESVCVGGRRGWTRAINQESTFDRTRVYGNSCVTLNSFSNYNRIKYNRLCIQMLVYYYTRCEAFYPEADINESYVLGISITHGSPRQHFLSLALLENECTNVDDDNIPEFVGNNYVINYCDDIYDCNFRTTTEANLAYTTTDNMEIRTCNGYQYIGRSYSYYRVYKLKVLLQ